MRIPTDINYREDYLVGLLNTSHDDYDDVDSKRYLDDRLFNCKTAMMILSAQCDRINDFSNIKLAGFIEYDTLDTTFKINCYSLSNGLLASDWWIIDGSGYVYANFDYIIRCDGMFIQYNWDRGRSPRYSYTRQMIEKYYLSRHKCVVSELVPIRRAFKCWMRLIRWCRDNYTIDLMHYKSDWNGPTIININPIEDYENYISNFKGEYRLRISNK